MRALTTTMCSILATATLGSAQGHAQDQARRLEPATARFAHEFTRIGGIRELSDGLLLVEDDNELFALDPRSGAARPVGARGRGPNEYLDVGTFIPRAGDTTWFPDGSNRRFVVLVRDRIVRVTEANDTLTRLLGTSLVGSDRQGRLLAVRPVPPATPAAGRAREQQQLVRVDPRTMRVDTMAPLQGMEWEWRPVGPPERKAVSARTVIFASPDLVAVSAEGWVAIARQSPYRVDWHPPAGAPRPGAPIEAEAPKVTDAVRADWIARQEAFAGRPMGAMLEGYSWAESVPPFEGQLLVAPGDGGVLVPRTVWSGSRGREYDLVDRRGTRVARLRLPESERIVGTTTGTLFVAERDEDGTERLRRHPWR